MKTLFLILISCLVALSSSAQMGDDVESVAAKILVYQLPNGGWSKQLEDGSKVDYQSPITKELTEKIKKLGDKYATIDNNATTREIRLLLEAYTATKKNSYLAAAERGIAYLLAAQYDSGGFPQYYPNTSSYRSQITLNDNAMINALTILDNTARGVTSYEAINTSLRTRAEKAVAIGVECLLKLQFKQNNNLTIWAAQYDHKSFLPAQARNFEPAALSTSESVQVVRFLMKQPATAAIKQSIEAAINWFKNHDIEGFRFDRSVDEKTGLDIRELIADSTAVSWARFYDLENNRPVFGDRDKTITYNFEEVSAERKNGYSWFGSWPNDLINKDYPKWINKINRAIKNK